GDDPATLVAEVHLDPEELPGSLHLLGGHDLPDLEPDPAEFLDIDESGVRRGGFWLVHLRLLPFRSRARSLSGDRSPDGKPGQIGLLVDAGKEGFRAGDRTTGDELSPPEFAQTSGVRILGDPELSPQATGGAGDDGGEKEPYSAQRLQDLVENPRPRR